MGYLISDESLRNGFVKSLSENKDNLYSRCYISKSNGKKRKISIPYKILDDIQKEIYKEILIPNSHKISAYARAYRPGASIKLAVKPHINKKKILCIDIRDFFGSITKEMVKYVFIHYCKKSNDIAESLSEICTLDGCLPQGTSTSPMLSNFVFIEFDVILSYYCNKFGLAYTRYADDIFISGDFNEAYMLGLVKRILKHTHFGINMVLTEPHNFDINYDKVRVLKNSDRQIILGLLVNKKMRVPKEQRREMRQAAYYIKKFGIDDYMNRKNLTKQEQLSWHGKISYMRFVEPKNQDICYVYEQLHKYMYRCDGLQNGELRMWIR